MSILRIVGLRWIVVLFTLIYLSTFTFLSPGHCDEWIYVGKVDDFTYYYTNTNIEIDRKSKQIKVWVKWKYTDIGIKSYINFRKNRRLNVLNYQNLIGSLIYYLFDYSNLHYLILSIYDYSISEKIIGNWINPNRDIGWRDIPPQCVGDDILNKILKDHNIKR